MTAPVRDLSHVEAPHIIELSALVWKRCGRPPT
jgi:hypothetical protein